MPIDFIITFFQEFAALENKLMQSHKRINRGEDQDPRGKTPNLPSSPSAIRPVLSTFRSEALLSSSNLSSLSYLPSPMKIAESLSI